MNIDEWIEKIVNGSGGFVDFENHEWPVYHNSREYSIAAFVVRCLANPKLEGSQEVLDAIIERRKEIQHA